MNMFSSGLCYSRLSLCCQAAGFGSHQVSLGELRALAGTGAWHRVSFLILTLSEFHFFKILIYLKFLLRNP